MLDKNQIAALSVGLGISFITLLLLVSINFFRNIYKSTFSKNIIFNIKKWIYILSVFMINIAGCYLVYYTSNLRILIYVILALKSKDIIGSLLFIFTIWFRKEPDVQIKKRVPLKKELGYPIDVQEETTEQEERNNTVAFIPVYKESCPQLLRTIESILTNKINNYLLICIISEGETPYNLNHFFTEFLLTETLNYTTWLGNTINVNIVYGRKNNKDVIFIGKEFRTGKKDSIIMCNDIFNTKRGNICEVSNNFSERVRENIKELFNIITFDYLFCTDADTVLSDNTLTCLSDSIKRRNAVASCGIVNTYNGTNGTIIETYGSKLINKLQNYQYLYGQYLRRTNEDLVNQVLCLPGCISMFKLHVEASGKALEMFSEVPSVDNMIHSSVQLVGTDRRYTSCLIRTNKDARIVLDKRCHAYTVPPSNFSMYVNQRRRWSSNMYFNGLTNIYAANINILLRLFNILDYLRLSLVYFRLFNTIYFIYIIASSDIYTSLSGKQLLIRFIPVIVIVMFPTLCFLVYSLFVSHLRKQYLVLFLMYFVNKVLTSFSSVVVTTVMLFNIGNYNWDVKIEDVIIITDDSSSSI
jgi:chitin synthase